MNPTPELPSQDAFVSRALEVTIRIALVSLLSVWCFLILRPFLIPIIWGGIIAVALYPAHLHVSRLLGGRPRLSAVLFTALGLVVLVVPIVLFAGSVVGGVQSVAGQLEAQTLQVPPPPAEVADWPIVGRPVYDVWSRASGNLGDTLRQFAPQLRAAGAWLLEAGAGTGAAVAQFLISILIAGVFLASSEGGLRVSGRVAAKLVGSEGGRYVTMVGQTVRSVALGILGVAVIQATLLGIGFVAVGLPYAGVWILACLALTVLQLPSAIVFVPLVIYVFAHDSTVVAIAFTVWSLIAGLSDNVLKPMLLGRGLATPMIVIFMGSIGGFLASGFIGLFVGAVVLAMGYELMHAWLSEREARPQVPEPAPAAK